MGQNNGAPRSGRVGGMFKSNLLRGRLIRLTAANPEKDAEAFARWTSDSEFLRLLDGAPARPRSFSRAKALLEEEREGDSSFFFILRPLESDRALGHVGLWTFWNNGNAWLGIGIGDRNDWNKGYGTEALQLILRYGFTELNLHRISLTVLEGNNRAMRAYQKVGFVHEGMMREHSRYDGQWYGEVFMGVLREDWLNKGGVAGDE